MTKEQVITAMNALPDFFLADELIERLMVVEQINEGLKDVEEGNVYTHEEVIKHMQDYMASKRNGEDKMVA